MNCFEGQLKESAKVRRPGAAGQCSDSSDNNVRISHGLHFPETCLFDEGVEACIHEIQDPHEITCRLHEQTKGWATCEHLTA